jgi:aspartate 1-decarboxylase
MLAAKIHRATVTETDIDYEGSVTLDGVLLETAGMLPFQEVHVWDVDNGARLITYLLPGERSSGTVCINGAAAHLIRPGDRVILATFASLEEDEARRHVPRVVLVDGANRVIQPDHHERPCQVSPSA